MAIISDPNTSSNRDEVARVDQVISDLVQQTMRTRNLGYKEALLETRHANPEPFREAQRLRNHSNQITYIALPSGEAETAQQAARKAIVERLRAELTSDDVQDA